MCPPVETPPAMLGRSVTFAWNASTEATHALAMCKSILRTAEKVTILSDGTATLRGTTAEDLVEYLSLHGVSAAVESFAATRRIGAALLEASHGLGADLMIMGAYGDSHERETIFGGNTQVVVDSAEMPVLLSH